MTDQFPRAHRGTTVARGRVVAIVDDDLSVRTALRRLLTSAGFEVATFETAKEFLDKAHCQGVGCAILDVRMPGLDGFALQNRLGQAAPDLPIVFVTAHQDRGEAQDARSHGALAFLPKPVEGQVLLDVVTRALRRDAPGPAKA